MRLGRSAALLSVWCAACASPGAAVVEEGFGDSARQLQWSYGRSAGDRPTLSAAVAGISQPELSLICTNAGRLDVTAPGFQIAKPKGPGFPKSFVVEGGTVRLTTTPIWETAAGHIAPQGAFKVTAPQMRDLLAGDGLRAAIPAGEDGDLESRFPAVPPPLAQSFLADCLG